MNYCYLLILSFFLSSSVWALDTKTLLAGTDFQAQGFSFDIQQWKHPKGARVYFVETPELPMLDIQMVFDAGAARDGGKHGLAKLTNGLLEEGSQSYSANQIADRFERVGAQFQFQSLRDMSVVGLRTLTDEEALETSLTTFIEVVAKPSFESGAVERVKSQALVALQLQEASPAAIAQKAFYQALYQSHPYANPPGGSTETIQAITVNDVKQFHRQYYQAENVVIALVGAVSREKAEAIVEQIVAALPMGKPAEEIPVPKPLETAQSVEVNFPSSQTHVHLGTLGVAQGSSDYVALYVGNHILGGHGLVSILNEAIREQKGLAYHVESGILPMRATGPFYISLQTRNESTSEVIAISQQQLNQFLSKGPSTSQLEAAKKNILGSYALRSASNAAIVSHLSVIGFYDLPLNYFAKFNQAVKKLTPKKVQQAFQQYIDQDKLVKVTVGKPV